ncbi:unspecified product [Leptomonas pyrrhocoris]|uniref:Unspecified product n=1 Tax=Leptomonas pyrrhocoris TaxID=157538 RepID=A0A0M9FSC2_LEPPY|nr:unspecified product [Leptomonas pyrrhocoris]XP_015653379.1 unspecified product [Leptomonas pyrrhocoris]XP_015653380.1 unspecified product [Leptomonas pyrrhocoris]KPA74939.1 unspecified product [Leptomonas pyrrhocoris]KPA74940.1 unspecified product [Leptomonas pyrrhocoris]KPA74941.1 unspecified product [Leptomonas pyrrhocoris]|eukprot:XP_015653378.1 unspecified product [Leptomonas pyrrhocoris]
MSTTVPPPTQRVRCVYTTVLSSKATRYFAVAPVKLYENILATQLRDDVTALVAANAEDGGACCNTANTNSTSSGSSSTSDMPLPSPTKPCVCLTNVTLLEVNRRFADMPNLLGVTFEVYYAVYEYKDGQLISSSSSTSTSTSTPVPTLPFAWTTPRNSAFPHVVSNLFHALTRKTYLSELTASPSVLAHVTIDEVDFVLHSDYDFGDDDNDDGRGEDGRLTGAEGFHAFQMTTKAAPEACPTSAASVLLGSDDDATTVVDYCTALRGPVSPAYAYTPAMFKVHKTDPNGTVVTYVYPDAVVYAAKGIDVSSSSARCDGVMCPIGILCGVVMIMLVLAASIAFVVHRCRRRRNEREDEKRLLQRQQR